MQISERISAEACEKLKAAIDEVDGAEVLAVCELDQDGVIVSVNIAARGGASSVPALYPHMDRGSVVVHNHPSGELRPSAPDLAVAAELGNRGIGSYIVNNSLSEIFVIAEPLLRAELRLLNIPEAAEYLEPGGAASRTIPGYESRESQIQMLCSVAEAFNEDHLTAAEAGTGVGKSFAYLLPAMLWAASNEERVVISTATINLQQQLIEKDIPAVNKMLPEPVQAVLVKGRGNYLCWNRLQEITQENELFGEGEEELVGIQAWAENSADGSRSDVPFMVPDSLWMKVRSEADSCLMLRCANREKCFLAKARRAAAGARVLVVNHHLLFSDLAIRVQGLGFEGTAVLPPFHRIIFDEAHNIESSATSFFSDSLTSAALRRNLSRLLRTRRTRRIGLLMRIQEAGFLNDEALTRIESALAQLETSISAADADTLQVLNGRFNLRLLGTEGELYRSSLFPALDTLRHDLLHFIGLLSDLYAVLNDELSDSAEAYELKGAIRRLEGSAALCRRFVEHEDDAGSVYWIEQRRSETGVPTPRLQRTPLSIREVMEEAVFTPYSTVIFTSATLTVGENFSYWAGRVGLDVGDERTRLRVFPSPFRYDTNVLLGVPNDAPSPDSVDYEAYLVEFVANALLISEGRALVLFTSYDMLRRVADAVRPRLAAIGVAVMRQGDDERSRLLRRFVQEPATALFATDSFWEGVDAPGETLQLVIICRLPFRVPTDPVLLARMDYIKAQGRNPFFELALPAAVMRLKQGFGRLMRRGDDRGVVFITDVRLTTKSYGKVFLDSLPGPPRSIENTGERLLEELERFLYP